MVNMSQLAVFLVFSAWPRPFGFHLQILEALRQKYHVYLTVVDNGLGLRPAFLSALGPQQRRIFPLRLYPAQVMTACLEQEPCAEVCLWWQAEAELNPQAFENWRMALETWTTVQPVFGGKGMPEKRASLSLRASERFQPAEGAFFPPILCFARENSAVVKQWAAPDAQMPLMLMGVDQATFAEVLGPLVPLSAEPPLSWPEAQNRLAHAHSARPLRRRVLLESLLRAFPGTAPLVKSLFPLLTLTEALQLLEDIEPLHWLDFPELLLWVCSALFAAGHSDAAIRVKDALDLLYPNLRLPASGWVPATLPCGLAVPAPESLRVIIWGQGPEPSDFCADFTPLLRLGAAFSWLQASESGCEDFATLIADIREDWILVLREQETLSPGDYKLLMQWLWAPPGHTVCLGAQIQEVDSQGQVVSVHQTVRLFPQAYPPRLVGELPFQLVSEAPMAPSRALTLVYEPLQVVPLPSALSRALELCLQRQWEAALPVFEPLVRQTPEVLQSAQVYLTWLRCLWENQEFSHFEADFSQCPQLYQQIPDYICLKGANLRRLRQWQLAEMALEQCLNLSPEALQHLPWYSPDSLERWPLLELRLLYWQQLFQIELDIRARQQQVRALRRVLLQLLPHFPAGQFLTVGWSIYLYLGCVALLGSHYTPGTHARDLFLQNLPPGSEAVMEVYYIETALLYLSGQFSVLPDRLPPGQSYESMRDLQQDPAYLMPFTETLWQMTEMDGPHMARAFLVCSSLFYRDISYLLWLARLQSAAGQSAEAHFSLKTAALIFPHHPLLPAGTASD